VLFQASADDILKEIADRRKDQIVSTGPLGNGTSFFAGIREKRQAGVCSGCCLPGHPGQAGVPGKAGTPGTPGMVIISPPRTPVRCLQASLADRVNQVVRRLCARK
jgi:hypothetical protein